MLLGLTERLALEFPPPPHFTPKRVCPKVPSKVLCLGVAPLTVVWREENSKTGQGQTTVPWSTARGQPFPTKVTTVYPMATNEPMVGKRSWIVTCGKLSRGENSISSSSQCPDFPSQFLQDAVKSSSVMSSLSVANCYFTWRPH